MRISAPMLRRVTDNLWRAETTFRVGPAFSIPVASVISRGSSGAVTIISPIRLTDEQARAIDELGTVTTLIAPNRFHHLALPKAIERWPSAKVWGAPGLAAKRADIKFDSELTTGAAIDDYVAIVIGGSPRASEVALFHRPTRSLVLTDLLFNIHDAPSLGWMGRAYLRASKALGRVGQSVVWRFLVKDRAAASESVRAVLALDFVRVLPSHGEPIEGDARAVVTAALSRMS